METLLVMCPQNSFFDSNGSVFMGERADILRIRLINYLSNFPGKKIFFREKHAEADNFFVNDKTHSIVNTHDFSVVEDLKKYADIFYDTVCYNAFFNTGFDVYVKKEKVTSATIVGVETHKSILFTVEELRNRGIEVSLIEPLLASRDLYMHDNALTLMVNYLGVRMTYE